MRGRPPGPLLGSPLCIRGDWYTTVHCCKVGLRGRDKRLLVACGWLLRSWHCNSSVVWRDSIIITDYTEWGLNEVLFSLSSINPDLSLSLPLPLPLPLPPPLSLPLPHTHTLSLPPPLSLSFSLSPPLSLSPSLSNPLLRSLSPSPSYSLPPPLSLFIGFNDWLLSRSPHHLTQSWRDVCIKQQQI